MTKWVGARNTPPHIFYQPYHVMVRMFLMKLIFSIYAILLCFFVSSNLSAYGNNQSNQSAFTGEKNPLSTAPAQKTEFIVKLKRTDSSKFKEKANRSSANRLEKMLQIGPFTSKPLFKTKSTNVPKGPSRHAKHHSNVSSPYRDYKTSNRDNDIFIVSIEEDKWQSTYDALKNNPNVEYVIPNYTVTVNSVPNDPYYVTDLWGMEAIKFDELTKPSKFSKEVVIAVIDSGLDLTHPDIQEKYFHNDQEIAGNGIDDDANGFVDDIHGWSFVENTGSMKDDHGHGTHVAGTIGAVTNNNIGIAGIVDNGLILPIRSLNRQGNGSLSDIIEGIDYAVIMGADVINMSLGAEFDFFDANAKVFMQEMNERFRIIADEENIAIVVAAGNNHDNNVHNYWPASAENVITVGALAKGVKDGEVTYVPSSFSNFGNDIDVWAPGSAILSLKSIDATSPQIVERYNGYALANGTSMASPHVAGAAALIKSAFPRLTGNQVKNLLKYTASDIDEMLLEKGIVNVKGIESTLYPSATVDIHLEHDYYYIDNNSQADIKIHGYIYAIESGTYRISLENENGDIYSTVSGSFADNEDTSRLLATLPYPSENNNGLAEFKIVVSAENSMTSKTLSAPIIINDSARIAEGYNANFPFFGSQYTSFPGSQNVPYSNVIDLDGDGVSELVVVRTSSLSADANQLFVYDLNGNIKPGFPYSFSASVPITNMKLYFKDFDGDNNQEIVILYVDTRYRSGPTKLNALVIENNGQEHASSFSVDMFRENVFRQQASQIIFTDYDNDGEEDVIVFQTVYENVKQFSHLQANVYDFQGNELAAKQYEIEPSVRWKRYYLYDSFPIVNKKHNQSKKYVLYSNRALGVYPSHLLIFDHNLDLIGKDFSSVNKSNYKTFDLDRDGEMELGHILSYGNENDYHQLKIYKNDFSDVMSINLPLRTRTSHDYNFFIGNILGDEQNEIIVTNERYSENSSYYNKYNREISIYNVEGELISKHNLTKFNLDRLFSLVDVDNDGYDELLFTPQFFQDTVSIRNGDFTLVDEEKLTSRASGINQLPAISIRSYPLISKLEEEGNYHLFLNNRKINAIDLGVSDPQKVRWFHGYGTNVNDFSMNDFESVKELIVQFDIPESYHSAYKNHVIKAVAENGEIVNGNIVIEGNSAKVVFDTLLFGHYSIQFMAENFWYNFSGEQEVHFSQHGQTVNMNIERLAKPHKSYVYVKIKADKSFDNIEGVNDIAMIKNLTTGVRMEDSGLLLRRSTPDYNEYHLYTRKANPKEVYEISLSGVKGGYRYFIDTVEIQAMTDNYYNGVNATLQREAITD
ncbi:hypothetical protein CBF23_000875 [Marinomonas agarivorans]|nr:hypothetical protein CBF23_000875 [Marinomonas agarivorans]